jgi:Plasmid pRiA4b ORF-3-like protein
MIWRRVQVPASISLRELHGVIQVVTGWEGIHLFQFMLRARRFGDVTLTANTALYSSRRNLAPREINDLGCAKGDLVAHSNGYTQLM